MIQFFANLAIIDSLSGFFNPFLILVGVWGLDLLCKFLHQLFLL